MQSSITTRRLTQREISLVQGVIDAKTNKAIAEELGLSINSIKVYLYRIFTKLGVENRAELANWGRAYAAAHESINRRYKEQHPDVSQPKPVFQGVDVTEYEVFSAMARQIILTKDQIAEITALLRKK